MKRPGDNPIPVVGPTRVHQATISNEADLTQYLAERVMGWKIAPDRYLTSARGWIPRWRFQPLNNVGDAFDVLDKASKKYRLSGGSGCLFIAEVEIGDAIGRSMGESKPRSITLALARALGLEVGE